MIQLSIIIVNYKSAPLVLDCLDSVYEQTRSTAFEVLVVDNCSGDDSREQIISRFPGIRWIDMDYNAGFARANNEGIRQSNGQLVLLLNPDTLIEGQAIDGCVSFFARSSHVACGVQLLNPDRSPQISGNYVMPGALNNVLPLPVLGVAVKWMGDLFRVSAPHVPDADEEKLVDWINGAFLMVKKEAIAKAGLLDEDFFLYAEESEWCGRLRKTGTICLYGQFKVIHLQGQTANSEFESSGRGYSNFSDRKGFQIMVSNFLRIRKQFGVVWFLFHLLVYTLEIPLFFLVSLIAVLIPRAKRYRLSAWSGYTRNVLKLWSLAPRMIRGKPYFYKFL